jgi:hypothetical protein
MRTVLLGGLAIGLLAAGEAGARTERLRWTHPDPGNVDRYTIYIGSASRSYGTTQDVVAPPRDGTNAFFVDITVADDATVFVAVSATANGLESDLSNERRRDPEPSDPVDPPDPGPAQAGVQRFVLWDATANVVADTNFETDEVVSLTDLPCATIGVMPNTYLRTVGTPGSVRFSVNGEVPECTEVEVTHDDDPPYALGSEASADNLACHELLTTVGTHTVSVTPFDGDGCTGAEGTTRMVRFIVEAGDPPAPDPEPVPLGKPGRPTLVPF